MKKVIAILLVLLVTGVVFGSTTDLSLEATVQAAPIYIAISQGSEITSLGLSAFQNADIGTVEFASIDPEAETAPTISDLFANVRVNTRNSFDVRISAEDLKQSGTGASIRYTVGSISSTAEIAAEAPTEASSILLTVDGSENNGMTVLNSGFSITLSSGAEDSLAYQNALAGEYEGTVRFWVTAQ